MRIDLKNIGNFLLDKYLLILSIVFVLTIITSVGLSNFKLDASSDALVLESDESLKIYREAEDEFGDSSFLIVTYEPYIELFSDYSLNRIANLENDLKNIDCVIHLANVANDPSVELNPNLSWEINTLGMHTLCEVCVKSKIKKFIYRTHSCLIILLLVCGQVHAIYRQLL